MLNKENFCRISNLVDRLTKQLNFAKVTFSEGERLKKVAECAGEICPYSKVTVLFSEAAFNEYGEKFLTLIKNQSLTPLSIVIQPTESKDDIEIIAESLPENTRLILTADAELIFCAEAIAKERGIECVIGLTEFPKRFFGNLNPAPISFVLDSNCSFSPSDVYESVVSKIVSLLDIKLKQFFKIIVKNFSVIDEFIEILDCALTSKEENSLMESAICLELIEVALKHYSTAYDIKTSLCIIKLVADNANGEFALVPNYIKRAKEASVIYNVKYLQVLENFKSQLAGLKSAGENLTDIRKGISALAKEYLGLAPQIVDNFKRLGGESRVSAKEVLRAIKYAGDIHYYNNSMSLLRENGCLEQIK